MITYKFTLSIGYPTATRKEDISVEDLGFSDEEWEDMSEDQQVEELETVWRDWADQYIDGGWEQMSRTNHRAKEGA